jgi:hypothetical protein
MLENTTQQGHLLTLDYVAYPCYTTRQTLLFDSKKEKASKEEKPNQKDRK